MPPLETYDVGTIAFCTGDVTFDCNGATLRRYPQMIDAVQGWGPYERINIQDCNLVTSREEDGISLVSNYTVIKDNNLAGFGGISVGGHYSTVEHNFVSGAINGITVSGSHNLVKDNFLNSNYRGIRVSWGGNTRSNFNTITNNNIDMSIWDGIYIMGMENKVFGNKIMRSFGSGIFIYRGGDEFGYEGNNTVEDNVISDSREHGIKIESTSSNVIQKNNISLSALDGIYAGPSRGTIIRENFIKDNNRNGIHLDILGGNNKIIKDNNITGNQKNGILLNASLGSKVFDVVLSGNKISGNTEKGIYITEPAFEVNVTDNFVSRNGMEGILFDNNGGYDKSYLVNVSGNTVFLNEGDGIRLLYFNNNSFYRLPNFIGFNNVTKNLGNGIYLEKSENNLIFGNYIEENNIGVFRGKGGITLFKSKFNFLKNNTANYNVGSGIYVMDTSQPINGVNNRIESNLLKDNFGSGVSFDTSNLNLISGNNISANHQYGIELIKAANNNNIQDNIVGGDLRNGNLEEGIFINLSDFNTITGNLISGNHESGVIVYSSNGNIIGKSHKGNIIENNLWDGIRLNGDQNTKVQGNTISTNAQSGIFANGLFAFISGNNLKLNGNAGIDLNGATAANIIENTIENNLNGISMWESDSNSLTSNQIKKNFNNGIFIRNSDSENINFNTVCYNAVLDFSLTNSLDNQGDRNRCDNPDGWRDSSREEGCRYFCIPEEYNLTAFDFGDAQDPPYASLLANDGARHDFIGLEYLGDGVDGESDALITDLDENDDGVSSWAGALQSGFVDVKVSLFYRLSPRYQGVPIYLSGWIDWNEDGVWDNGEKSISKQINAIEFSSNSQIFNVPIEIMPTNATDVWVRLRLFYGEDGNATGLVNYGEVEDYFVAVNVTGNLPPEIISSPLERTPVRRAYAYDVEAIDLNNDVLEYLLVEYPDGMNINTSTGLITWFPDFGQMGYNNVSVVVRDPYNAYDEQNYTLNVLPVWSVR